LGSWQFLGIEAVAGPVSSFSPISSSGLTESVGGAIEADDCRVRRGAGDWNRSRTACRTRSWSRPGMPPSGLRLAALVVVIVAVRTVMFVPMFVVIPVMVVGEVAVPAFPPTGEILSTVVIGRDPVGALKRCPCPVAVVPSVVRSLRIPVALDPLIARAGLAWHVVGARRWRFANANADGNLRLSRRRRDEEHC